MTKNGVDRERHGVKPLKWIATLAALAAGAYYFYAGKNAARNRKRMSDWFLDMKRDLAGQLRRLRDMNEKTYEKIIDDIRIKYAGLANIDRHEFARMIEELRDHWKNIRTQIKEGEKKVSERNKKHRRPGK